MSSERFTWDVPPDEELEQELRQYEEETIKYRIIRARFLISELGPPVSMLLPGGTPTVTAYHEMMRTFLYGLDLSTISSAHIFLEHLLGNHLILCGDDNVAERGLAAIVEKCVELEVLSEAVSLKITGLRKMRISYSHTHVGLKDRSYIKRLIDAEYKVPDELLEEDAKIAIKTVVDVLRYLNPSWKPDSCNKND